MSTSAALGTSQGTNPTTHASHPRMSGRRGVNRAKAGRQRAEHTHGEADGCDHESSCPCVTVGRGQVRRLDLVDATAHLVDGAVHHDVATLHDVDTIGDAEGQPHVLFDEQHAGRLLGRDPPHGVEEAPDDAGGEAERQLVEEEQRGLGRDRTREGEHLLLAARQQPGDATEQGLELGEQPRPRRRRERPRPAGCRRW